MIHLVYQIAVPVGDGEVACQAYHAELCETDNLMAWLDDHRVFAAHIYKTKELADKAVRDLNAGYGGVLFEDWLKEDKE